ncbi:hypothetical protein N7492_010323 [Penicillium capsulatum]|uniref:Transcription factor domain-containing protein n=1 Tax=Penicillium capsulatum TaxID=69766 RepID=A0A9W9HL50_9EURO|nr:hypothetical protein N7492_010323 [Penicillium capsulatum]KAJ6112828.1 hypothetical protein N7512_008152 [Penicillium capsulatum]
MECLFSNGVLSLPTVSLQSSLAQAFVECVLPSMPIVKWQDILNTIDDRSGGHGSISLLLYHAILFSATTFADLDFLHDAGFSSRHEAKSRHFTDCQIALRLRRRPIIKEAEFCHPILNENDFAHWILSPENRVPTPGCTLARNIQLQRNLSDLCIANAQLRICIRTVMNVQAKDIISPSATPASSTSEASDDAEYTARAHTSETKLTEWAGSLPPSCHCQPVEPSSVDDDPIIFTQRRLLYMKFYTTIAVFHQSQPFPWSKFGIQHGAHQITRAALELYQRNLHNRLPLVVHFLQMKEPRFEQKGQTTQNFQYALAIMASLRDLRREASNVTASALKILENVVFTDGEEGKQKSESAHDS